mmetsp:Transcript_13140/g.20425  ORF Transcript_13140/g.20425 Transcript_13140/m.20425 type:complete len:176 (-) Transcript_13140:40-567(-)
MTDLTIVQNTKPGKPILFVALYALTLVALIVPKVPDMVLKGGVLVYVTVIGTMVSSALTLCLQETTLMTRIKKLYRDAIKTKTPQSNFVNKIMATLRGGKKTQYIQYYVVAAVSFLVSDSVLGYSKFVEKEERTGVIMFTYWLALLLFTWSAFEEVPCAPCIKKGLFDKSGTKKD